jgi:hypothetical protein
MAFTYQAVLSTGSSLTAGGVLIVQEPLLEGRTVEHYGQSWRVQRIDDHQQPPLATLHSLATDGAS